MATTPAAAPAETGTARVVLVTGGSSGIGEATARLLAADGWTVVAAARRTERMAALAEAGIEVAALDVTDEASVRACVEGVLERHGRLDALVNNAGYGSYGAVEDVDVDEARRQFEVNLFGLARVTQLVLPTMRAQGSGTIVNISSMGGRIYTGFGAWYHATKHALEGFSDCLRLEVAPFGVDVVVIQPGGIRTEWGTIAAEGLAEASGPGSPSGAYTARAQDAADGMRQRYTGHQLSEPVVVARAVRTALDARRPRTRYAIGFGAKPLMALRAVLPDRAFDRLLGLVMD
ncbi:oxidoreductase [Nocardioides bruguierae]|uniref:Oxidoreductase n=1 Tax=Nocardioides bruguierae TaxID=2945102 RepID=A0A9X2DE71_9ACTN|nr:oxidoreductase [Nocardioides bruguierae]MCM0622784.1 oxidoreductase [Nocardioides bruguierae]